MIGAMMGAEELQKAEFKIAGRDYKITILPSLQAYSLFMNHVRPCFAAMKGVDLEKPEAMFEVFAALDSHHVNELQKEFVRHCLYTRNDANQMVKIATDPEGLLKDVEPAHIMVLMLRAFARNFGTFYSAFATEIAEMARGMGVEFDPNQQTHSSTPESEQTSLPFQT